MSIPKKRKQIAPNKERIDQALHTASAIQTPGAVPEETAASTENAATSPQKKMGRPPLVGSRTARMTFYLAQETLDRFSLAFPQEQLKRMKSGEKVDKSLILEAILKTWLDGNGY